MTHYPFFADTTLLKKVAYPKLLELLSSIDEVIFIANADDLELVYANDACNRIYGYTPAEIMVDKNIFLTASIKMIRRSFLIRTPE
jgi:PAS domain-containing protein